MHTLQFRDGSRQTVYSPKDFIDLCETYMGLDAKCYIESLFQDLESAKEEMRLCRNSAEAQLMELVSDGKFVDDESRNAFAEEVSAIMEDVYGIE